MILTSKAPCRVDMAGGTLDNRVMGSLLGRVLEEINLLDLVGRGGTSEFRCFATHVHANQLSLVVNHSRPAVALLEGTRCVLSWVANQAGIGDVVVS